MDIGRRSQNSPPLCRSFYLQYFLYCIQKIPLTVVDHKSLYNLELQIIHTKFELYNWYVKVNYQLATLILTKMLSLVNIL